MENCYIVPAIRNAHSGILSLTHVNNCTLAEIKETPVLIRDALECAISDYPNCVEFDVRHNSNKYGLTILVYESDCVPAAVKPDFLTLDGRTVHLVHRDAIA